MMTVGGLGAQPGDVRVASLDVPAQLSNGNGTCNFWFAAENMRVTGDVNWVASQATSFRRMQVDGDMQLTAGSSNSWGSGGFIADSAVAGTIDANVQQQWLTRNSAWGAWEGGDINLTFVGSAAGSPVPAKGINGLDTVTVEKTPVVREKPFLIFDDGYYVAVPDIRKNAAGVSWQGANDGYTYIPLSDFYVARADRDTAATLNAALDAGKHLFFTPGIYDIAEPLQVKKAGTVVLGCGLATLRCADENGTAIMYVSDIGGVKLGGLLFDAGAHSENLLRIGDEKTGVSHAADPIFCSDVYFRIGGARQCATYVRQTLVINANDVVGDNFWVWRGDHSYGVGWAYSEFTDEEGNKVTNGNVTKNGLVVNGDNVLAYALMVEHFHEYQAVWNGENGTVYFYQSETPYDPVQADWTSHDGAAPGYASYKVGDGVQKHTAYGVGVYGYSSGCDLANAIEAPAADGVYFEHLFTVMLSGHRGGAIYNVINGAGGRVDADRFDRTVEFYYGGQIQETGRG